MVLEMTDTISIAEFDFDALSLAELKSLEKKVVKAIATFEDRKKKEALSELEAKAKELGYSLSELTGGKAPKMKVAGSPKYRNPADPTQTWTGKGRRPDWFNAALAAGTSADDLAI
ncbi:H-NS histone family protein [Thalassovita autumnalis]|uniref:H-NS histone family protein n=2 Tax=Thalassovita autumnalis TaxID=2072972 RepID=A0A0P1G579_9RHOB|nr:H-NS histone family protein [Thalassovita autumnalis]CUH74140.1 H-NS histone family protein [Thalassovita autumnalis]